MDYRPGQTTHRAQRLYHNSIDTHNPSRSTLDRGQSAGGYKMTQVDINDSAGYKITQVGGIHNED